MVDGKTVLAVIPARGGSKRCPRKNIREFRGRPLIAWSIDAAHKSKYVDQVVLSTEDLEIAQLAMNLGAFVQIRPPELATDQAYNEDVLRHVNERYKFDWIVLLQPTSPLRTPEDIDACVEKAQHGEACISYRSDGTKNGAVYVASREFLEKHDFSHERMRYVMPDERSLDIDYPHDFDR